MIINAQIAYSLALASAVKGCKHESGAYLYANAPASAGKYHTARKFGEERMFMQDAAGGLVTTMAAEKDYKNPEIRKLM